MSCLIRGRHFPRGRRLFGLGLPENDARHKVVELVLTEGLRLSKAGGFESVLIRSWLDTRSVRVNSEQGIEESVTAYRVLARGTLAHVESGIRGGDRLPVDDLSMIVHGPWIDGVHDSIRRHGDAGFVYGVRRDMARVMELELDPLLTVGLTRTICDHYDERILVARYED